MKLNQLIKIVNIKYEVIKKLLFNRIYTSRKNAYNFFCLNF